MTDKDDPAEGINARGSAWDGVDITHSNAPAGILTTSLGTKLRVLRERNAHISSENSPQLILDELLDALIKAEDSRALSVRNQR